MEDRFINIGTLSKRDRKFYELATVGGLDISEAYQQAFRPTEPNSIRAGLSKKRKKRPDLIAAIEAYKQTLFQEAQMAHRQEIIKQARDNALTQVEKREVLRQIITGELNDQVLVVIKGEVKSVIKPPSVRDKIRAIETDSKLAGHYAPIGIDHGASDMFIEAIKSLSNRKNESEGNPEETTKEPEADNPPPA